MILSLVGLSLKRKACVRLCLLRLVLSSLRRATQPAWPRLTLPKLSLCEWLQLALYNESGAGDADDKALICVFAWRG